MRVLSWIIFVSLAPCKVFADYHRGDGTAYSGDYEKDDTGFNACQLGTLDDRWEKYYGAFPSRSFNASVCGRCVKVRGIEKDAPSGWVTIMIVDECASCRGEHDVDMSSRALEESTGYRWDRKRVEWDFTECRNKYREGGYDVDRPPG